ncbi:hypothetical protein SCLCIDRAFT_25966 [Scleroderma citrinum Foug A]|uniref:Uncharacterized protein n=1 Tax=Scleroderma citrinum Foug A TaxID=1036808 RepID=A0A0C3A8Y0_9AGAM|nr:hypothetical protein SCLCIDRAFT_25966 [Scleroderma citrinum Foug A]
MRSNFHPSSNASQTNTQQSSNTDTAAWTQTSPSVQLTPTIIAMCIDFFAGNSMDPTWAVPADSPTNPFGRIHRLRHDITLPPPTSFMKHLPLHFQLLHPHVPLNYTLAHLQNLIAYVFDPAKKDEITALYNLRHPLSRLSCTVSLTKGKGKESTVPTDLVGHLFEVQTQVKVGQDGMIEEGLTWVKSSTTHDPYHYPANDLEGTLFLDDESDQWRWEAEEDIQLAKVWPKGGDLFRAIHHDAHTQIHITINMMKIPPQKGVGNRPCLFLAYGSISLSNPDGTLRLGTVETTRWNRVGADEHFLEAEAFKDHIGKGVDEDDLDEDAEGELNPDLSSATLPLYKMESSPFLASDSLNPVTPFPAEPLLHGRIEYQNCRLLKLMKENMKDAGLSNEEENEVDNPMDDDADSALEEKPSDWDPFQDGNEIC